MNTLTLLTIFDVVGLSLSRKHLDCWAVLFEIVNACSDGQHSSLGEIRKIWKQTKSLGSPQHNTTSSKRTIQSTVDQKQCNAASDEKKTNFS